MHEAYNVREPYVLMHPIVAIRPRHPLRCRPCERRDQSLESQRIVITHTIDKKGWRAVDPASDPTLKILPYAIVVRAGENFTDQSIHIQA